MGKRQKHRPTTDVFDQKPDYAMDVLAEEVKPKKPKAPSEDQLTVGIRLKSGVLDQLTKMKEQMEAEGEKAKAKETGSQKTAAQRKNLSPRKTPDPSDPDVTFAELFDPAPEDEESFEEMLSGSKQDWREFK